LREPYSAAQGHAERGRRCEDGSFIHEVTPLPAGVGRRVGRGGKKNRWQHA
jgi:hypothetical protein